MLGRREISHNLRMLENRFKEAIKSPKKIREANFYAKLAILEASGWLEQCVEDMFGSLAGANLTVLANINDYKKVIDENHGFNYHKYIKNRLSKNLLGLVLTEKLETKISADAKHVPMVAALTSLKTLRGSLAHSYLSGSVGTLQHVTLTIGLFNQAYDGLALLEKEINKIKFK